jgi:hypothetical protein
VNVSLARAMQVVPAQQPWQLAGVQEEGRQPPPPQL